MPTHALQNASTCLYRAQQHHDYMRVKSQHTPHHKKSGWDGRGGDGGGGLKLGTCFAGSDVLHDRGCGRQLPPAA